MDVLVFLCANADETVSAERILAEIWRGTFYGDNPVHKAVAQIRRALGDTSASSRYIETVRKRGYRVLAPVLMQERNGARSGYEPPAWSIDCPFQGLKPFEPHHAAIYFGRSHVIAHVLSAITEQRKNQRAFVLVVGSSGSGKTSLLQAGVLPMLIKGSDGVVAAGWTRCDPGPGAGAGLLDALAFAMLGWQVDGRPLFLPAEHGVLVEQLRLEPATVSVRISASLDRDYVSLRKQALEPCLAMLVDPLEGALSVDHPDGDECAQFDAAMAMLCTHPQVLLLGACRADFYPALLERLPNLARLKGGAGHVDLPPLTAGEVANCVRGPARAAGVTFECDANTQERLDDRLIEDAQRSPEMLPMLQHVLARLYIARAPGGMMTFRAYASIGGLVGAIAQHAEDVLLRLDAEARSTLDDVFALVAAVQPDHRALISRRAAFSDLAHAPTRRLVDAFIEARLFTSDLVGEERYFGTAHEVLLRQWPRAVAWADANRAWLQTHARLRLVASDWDHAGRPAHLLARSGPLVDDSAELRRRAPGRFTSVETLFLVSSLRVVRRNRAISLAVAVLIVVLSIASTVLAVREKGARANAEARRVQLEGLLDFALGDLADKLRPIGRLDVLGSVAGHALDTMAGVSDVDEGSALRRARALRTTAEVLVDQGRLEDADRALSEAEKRVDGVAANDGDAELEARFEHAQIAYWRGLITFREKRFERTRAYWTSYANDTQALQARDPTNIKWILERSYALNNLGSLAQTEGHFATSADAFRASTALKRDYLRAAPGDTAVQSELADSISWLADALDRSGRPLEALPLVAEQSALLSAAVASDPQNKSAARQNALAHVRAGMFAAEVGQIDAAKSELTEGIGLLDALTQHDPANRTWRRDLAYAQSQLGWLLAAIGPYTEALAWMRRAKHSLQSLQDDQQHPLEWRRLGVVIALRSAVLEARSARQEATSSVIDQCVAALRDMAAGAPDDRDTRAAFASSLVIQGDWLSATGNVEHAGVAWNEAKSRLPDAEDERAPDHVLLEPFSLVLNRLGDPAYVRWRAALAAAGYAYPAYIQDIVPQLLKQRGDIR